MIVNFFFVIILSVYTTDYGPTYSSLLNWDRKYFVEGSSETTLSNLECSTSSGVGSRYGATLAHISKNNTLLLIFGYTSSGHSNDIFSYSIVNEEWCLIKKGTLGEIINEENPSSFDPLHYPSKRSGHSSWRGQNDYEVYLFGGMTSNGLTNDLWVYSFERNNYKVLKRLQIDFSTTLLKDIKEYGEPFNYTDSYQPPVSMLSSSTVVDNRYVYIFGGIYKLNYIISQLNVYDMETNQFAYVSGEAPISNFCFNSFEKQLGQYVNGSHAPCGYGASMWNYNDEIYIFGGVHTYLGSSNSDLWKFRISDQMWGWFGGNSSDGNYTEGSQYPPSLAFSSYFQITGIDYFFLAFGHHNLGDVNQMWRYDPINSGWELISGSEEELVMNSSAKSFNYMIARSKSAVCVDDQKSIWFFGGLSSSEPQLIEELQRFRGFEDEVCGGKGTWSGSECVCFIEGYYGSLCNQYDCFGFYQNSSEVCNDGYGICQGPDNCTQFMCFDLDSRNNNVCGGHGSCIGPDQCDCDEDYDIVSDCSVWKCNEINYYEESACGIGTCESPNNCSCPVGYYGEWCDLWNCSGYEHKRTDVLICNGVGICGSPNNCTCPIGYLGDNCDEFVCKGDCNGHGNCSAPNECICNAGYGGAYCEKWNCSGVSKNEKEVCSSNGDCLEPDLCECSDSYFGDNCELFNCSMIRFDDKNVCSGRGNCTSPNKCACIDEVFGDSCEITDWNCSGINRAHRSVCYGRGECNSPDLCTCELGYTGDDCGIFYCNSYMMNDSSVCSGRGECTTPNNCECYNYSLSQYIFYTGAECETILDQRPFLEKYRYYISGFGASGGVIASIGIAVCFILGIFLAAHIRVKRKKNIKFAPKQGRITIVFTDIQSSTLLWRMNRSAMSKSIKLHDQLMRKLLVKNKGYEVKTIGDAFMCAFDDEENALVFALEVQNELTDIPYPEELYKLPNCGKEETENGEIKYNGLRVRIGIHSGEMEVKYSKLRNMYDYYGDNVNFASRVESSAPGGVIFVSQYFKTLVENLEVFEGLEWQDVGTRILKGIEEPQQLWCVYQRERFCPLEIDHSGKGKKGKNNLECIKKEELDRDFIRQPGGLTRSSGSFATLSQFDFTDSFILKNRKIVPTNEDAKEKLNEILPEGFDGGFDICDEKEVINQNEENNEDGESSRICCICLENKSDVLYMPCLHVSQCSQCPKPKPSIGRCPICRKIVDSWVKVFVT